MARRFHGSPVPATGFGGLTVIVGGGRGRRATERCGFPDIRANRSRPGLGRCPVDGLVVVVLVGRERVPLVRAHGHDVLDPVRSGEALGRQRPRGRRRRQQNRRRLGRVQRRYDLFPFPVARLCR